MDLILSTVLTHHRSQISANFGTIEVSVLYHISEPTCSCRNGRLKNLCMYFSPYPFRIDASA